MRKRIFIVLAMALCIALLIAAAPAAANAAEDVEYLDYDAHSGGMFEKNCNSATVVTSSDTTWTGSGTDGGWYVARGEVTIDQRVTVTGDVHLILADEANLTVKGGIKVFENNSLTIYAQSTEENMGTLTATATWKRAAIGGETDNNVGEITIYGGNIIATADQGDGYGSAGIGGVSNDSGTITIYDGQIKANGSNGQSWSNGGAGIRGTITIYGGQIEANGGNGGAAAHGGDGGAGIRGTITIYGGQIVATGGNGGSGATYGNDGVGILGTFSTEANGHAVIFASSISDNEDTTDWSGVIFEGTTGKVYGTSITLTENFTIPDGYTLTIPSNTTLTISNGVTLANNGIINNNGEIKVEGSGKFDGNPVGFSESGTKESPYIITNEAQLRAINTNLELGIDFYDKYFKLENDINLNPGIEFTSTGAPSGSSPTQWTPIGSLEHPFMGHFDGNNKKIIGIYINSTNTYQGLFGYIYGGSISNLTTENGFVCGGSGSNPAYVGGIVGYAKGTTINGCTNGSYISSSGNCNGGIAGQVGNTTISQCVNNGAIVAGRYQNGGIVGHADNSNVDQCVNYGNVTVTDHAAGIAAYNADGTVSNCINYGDVSTTGTYYTYTAGIVANNYHNRGSSIPEPKVYSCLNLGEITGYVGGNCIQGAIIAGHDNNAKQAENCFSVGDTQLGFVDSVTCETVTIEQLTSGEVAYKLSGSSDIKFGVDSEGNVVLTSMNPEAKIPIAVTFVSGANEKVVYTFSSSTVTFPSDPTLDSAYFLGWYNESTKVDSKEIFTTDTTLTAKFRYNAPNQNSVDIAYAAETISFADNLELNTKSDFTGTEITSGASISGYCGQTLYLRVKATESISASVAVAINIPSRHAAPAVPTGVVKTSDSIKMEAQTGCEYSINGTSWQKSAAFTELNTNTEYTVYVRAEATESAFASEASSVTVTTLATDGSGIVASGETAEHDGTSVKNDGENVTITNSGSTTTVTLPDGEGNVSIGENSNVTIPGGSKVQTGNGPTITVGDDTNGATVSTDGSVNLPANGSATVGNTEITVPNGGTVEPGTGAVTPSTGGSVTVGGTTITPPDGEAVTPGEDGNVLIPGGSTVTTGGSTVTIPEEGGTLDPGGEVVYTVTVTFDSTGGSEVTSQYIDVNTPVTEPEAPTRSGYSFAGWYTKSGERWNFNDPVTGDMTLYARWSMNNIPDTYDIEVVPGEGGSVRPNLYNSSAGATITLTVTPDDGFELAYITVDGKRISGASFTMPAHDVTVRAYFTRIGAGLPFNDVKSADWFYDAVSYVVSNGLMEGVSDTVFAPNATMSRAMVWTILARIDGETVTGANWIDTARTWAVANGVSDGTDPNGNVTREQLATMLWRYAGEPESSYSLAAFTDAGSVSDYAATAMAWAVENGIITGMTDTTLAPQGTATRAQCAAMLMRFVENV